MRTSHATTAVVATAVFALAVAQTSSFTSPTLTATSGGNTGSTPFANLFLDDDLDGKGGYAASIVSACADQTVYAIRCTSGAASATCGPNAPIITVTEGPSIFLASFSTQGDAYGEGATVAISESCDLHGTTSADCHAALTVTALGTTTSTAIDSTLTGTDNHRFQVAITGGAEKTASAIGTCSSGAIATVSSERAWAMAAVSVLGVIGFLSL